MKQFVSSIRLPHGSTDGADRYPGSCESLDYTFRKAENGWQYIQYLHQAHLCIRLRSCWPVRQLSTYDIRVADTRIANAHRLFVSDEAESINPVLSPSSPGNLTGIISIVDSMYINWVLHLVSCVNQYPVLSLFAHLARIPDVDPGRMQRHRRASSTSSHSSYSDRDSLLRTRPSSRASARRSPSFGVISSSPGSSVMSFSGNNSPVSMRPKSPGILPVPDIGSALGGSLYGVGMVGRRGSMNASLRSRNSKRDSVQ